MRRTAALALLLLLPALGCAGPKLRSAANVKPERAHRLCELRAGEEVTEGQALCIAQLAGLGLVAGEFTIREARSLSGEPTWVIDEKCGPLNPECIGITVRRSDGTILDTRYLYVIQGYGL